MRRRLAEVGGLLEACIQRWSGRAKSAQAMTTTIYLPLGLHPREPTIPNVRNFHGFGVNPGEMHGLSFSGSRMRHSVQSACVVQANDIKHALSKIDTSRASRCPTLCPVANLERYEDPSAAVRQFRSRPAVQLRELLLLVHSNALRYHGVDVTPEDTVEGKVGRQPVVSAAAVFVVVRTDLLRT